MIEDVKFLLRAIRLAEEAEKQGNLPIGALIVLDNKIIAEGQNSIATTKRPNRHAEIVTIENVSPDLWEKADKMTLYTTLEPCLMCLGTILVHRIGRVVFGANDRHGGATCVFNYMPPAFKTLKEHVDWLGPALPDKCDPLKRRVIVTALVHKKNRKKGLDPLYELLEKESDLS